MSVHKGLGGQIFMRVLAARFRDRRSASAVRERLLHVLRGDVTDVAIAPLGKPGHASSDDMVLAGRFQDHKADVAADLIRDAGGEVVTNVDEKWTRSRSTARSVPWTPDFSRERLHA